MTGIPAGFSGRIVRWQRTHGRNHLPWQNQADPYSVWLSEIMLQQTQVATVLDYYGRFIARFPDVRALALADADDVLALWSGLGYYSRARNLHRCAREVVSRYGGEFPGSAAQLQSLPGIGRSTAAAIAAFCFGERVAILDGNVKRVLTRVLAYGEDLAVVANERALWALAEQLLPRRELQEAMPAYTQGLMDLGATICLARKPSCLLCPVRELCAAHQTQSVDSYPVKRRAIRRTAQSLWLLKARRADGAVWLHKRAERGIWAGLYCLPAYECRDELVGAVDAKLHAALRDEEPFLHVLTHRDLHLHPTAVEVTDQAPLSAGGSWFTRDEWPRLGLPAPIRKLLENDAA